MSKQARADVLSAALWWKRNVGSSPTHLEAGLLHAQEKLSATPFIGVAVASAALPNLRRLALLQSRYFIFYDVDVAAGLVTVLRVWHMSRGRQPKLPRR
jgi:plasmid stabilization system protein ParE